MTTKTLFTAAFLATCTRLQIIAIAALLLLFAGGQSATARTLFVSADDDLQKVLDEAVYGDVIELQAGATFEGNFALRKPPKAKQPTTVENRHKLWITIRSSAFRRLPKRGTRVGPKHAEHMARIVSPNAAPALATKFGANRYQFVGLDITTTFKEVSNLILLGFDGPEGKQAKSRGYLPSHIAFERCYIHGRADGGTRRGIALNGRSVTIMDCYVSDFHKRGPETQAICSWNGPGPFKIVNNYLEASGENVMFGGADPTIRGLVPSDIEIRYNHFYKPQSWHKRHKDFAGVEWTVKNLLELKSARRVLIEGNIFENCWAQAQKGFAIVLTPRNQDRTAPWSAVEDVRIQRNLIRNASAGVMMMNQHIETRDGSNAHLSKTLQRITVANNVFWNISRADNGGPGQMFLLSAQPNAVPAQQIVIENNTLLHGGKAHSFITVGDHDKFATNLIVRNNITTMGAYGVWGSGASSGLPTIKQYFNGSMIEGNVFITPKTLKNYPPSNFSASSLDDIGFRDARAGDFRLSSQSRYRNLGTDRLNPGADHALVVRSIAHVLDGDRSTLQEDTDGTTAHAKGKRNNPRVSKKSP